jgi:hypothetical protein
VKTPMISESLFRDHHEGFSPGDDVGPVADSAVRQNLRGALTRFAAGDMGVGRRVVGPSR